jgi:hypothetical protein
MKTFLPFFMMIVLIGALAVQSDAATRYAKANGDWNSANTWTATVDGNTAASVPVAGDVVVIARNHTVAVNISNAACASVQIGGTTTGGGAGLLKFKAASQLTVSGAVALGGSATSNLQFGWLDMTDGGVLKCASVRTISSFDAWISGKGTLQLTAANTLPAQKFSTFNNLTINGGETTLGAAITVNGILTLTNGCIVSAAAKMLTLGSSATISGGGSASYVKGPMRLSWKAVTASKMFPVGKTTYEPLTISLTTPSNPVLQAECFDAKLSGVPASPLTVLSSHHYYQVSLVSGTASKGGTVTLPNNSDLVTTAPNLVVAQSTVPSGVFTPLTGNSGSSSQVTSAGFIPAGSSILVLGSTGGTLPVELTSFTAAACRNGILLSWMTATETNNAGFEIERRSASSGWQRLGFVDGSGSSNIQHQYSFNDAGVPGGSYSYRLKQIDRDGAYEYSNEVEASMAMTAEAYTIMQNYPNPFNPSTTIRFAVPADQQVELKVFNVLGQEVKTLFNGIAAGGVLHAVQFDATGLPSGMYLYRLSTGGKTEVKRMLLMR